MKTGRNELCPCGSGQKYKKCCLEKDQAAKVSDPINANTEGVDETEAKATTTHQRKHVSPYANYRYAEDKFRRAKKNWQN